MKKVSDTIKKIGIVGGLSPESTIYYYKYITQSYTKQFGDYSYPNIIIYSATFQDYIDWGKARDWGAMEEDLVDALNALEQAKADFAIIATNTMHHIYDSLVKRTNIPILSLVDAVCDHANKLDINKIGLLGTKFTMTHDFYPNALAKAGIETLVPSPENQTIVNDIIFDELVKGIIRDESKSKYLKIIEELVDQGAQGVILGCTEIPLLIKQEDLKIHVLDSSKIHAEAALKYALE
ncbi:MAG: amino acid racemase [Thermoplasmata archaeon]|nr:MAG: amino acid racemase [Thermoplasmata archaeon]